MPYRPPKDRRAAARVNRAVQAAAEANPAPQAADNWVIQAGVQINARMVNYRDVPWQPLGKLPPDPKPAPVRRVRATSNGRLRSVKLGDIIAAYYRSDNPGRDKWTIIDFRMPKAGEYFLGRSFDIEKYAKFDLPVGPRFILEVIKGKKPSIDELINDDLEVAMRRPE